MVEQREIVRAGVWYTVSNFIMKALQFLTIPVFSRLLSKADYGMYSNYATWLSIMVIIFTLSLHPSLLTARFDYEKRLSEFIGTILVLGSVFTLLISVVIHLNIEWFEQAFSMNRKYIYLLLAYCMVYPSLQIYQMLQKFQYHYKASVCITILSGVSATLLSLLGILVCENKLDGRIFGNQLPLLAVCGGIYLILLYRSKLKFCFEYVKYALHICIPYIFHLLGGMLLNSADKLMIIKILGEEYNANYSIAYMVAMVIYMFIMAMNDSFAPWLGECLKAGEAEKVRRFSVKYVGVFALIANGLLLSAPEILYICGGPQYMEAVWVIPPVILGYFFYFLYTICVDIEQYKKKNIWMAASTLGAALLNIALNGLVLERVGYIGAAYTTWVSYIALFILHVFLVYRLKLQDFVHFKFLGKLCIGESLFMGICLFLYQHSICRWSLLGLYLAALGIFAWKNRACLKRFKNS